MTPKIRTRLRPCDRKTQILKAAVNLSIEIGYTNIKAQQVAERANIRRGLIYHYFDTVDALRKQVMKTAVKQGFLDIILQGLSMGDPVALNAPEELKRKARKEN